MNRAVITGIAAEVRWSYHQVAQLGSWSLSVEPAGGTLTATVVSHDSFKVTQLPLTFVVPRPTGQPWRWPITSCSVTGDTLTATVGESEE